MANQLFLMASNEGQSPYGSLIFIVLIIFVFYFFMIRPQMKRQKEALKFRNNLQKGDKVITSGGIYGIITDVHDTYVMLEIDSNVKVKIDKNSIVASPADLQNTQK